MKLVAQMKLTGERDGMQVAVAIEVSGTQKGSVAGLAEYYGRHLEDLGLRETWDPQAGEQQPITAGGELLQRLLNGQAVKFECCDGIGRFVVKTHAPLQPVVFGIATALELNKAGLVTWDPDGLKLTRAGVDYATYLGSVEDPRD